MKRIITSLFVCASLVASAQIKISEDFTYEVSSPYQVVDGLKEYFSKDGEVYAIKYGRGKFTIQRFGGDKMNEVKRNEIPKSTGFDAESFEEIGGRYYFFYSIWDRAAGKEQLFAREIDFEACKFVDEGRLLFKVDGKVTGGFNAGTLFGYGGAPQGKFKFTSSFDESKLLVQYRRVPENRRDDLNNDVIGMYVYDAELNEDWSGDIEMPYTEKKMNNIGYSIDSKGDAYILAEVFKDETTRRYTKEGDPNYDLELIRVGATDQSLSKTKIELDDKFVNDVGFFEGKSGEIIIAGFYGNDKHGGTDGFYLSKIEDGSVNDVRYYEIPVDVMKLYLSDRKQEKMEKKDGQTDLKMHDMVLREIVFGEDGGITLYGERYYVVSNYNPNTKTTTYTYYYQEILGASIDAEGELRWMNKFPKNQRGSAARGGMGYYLITAGANDYLLFLDNVNNIELPMNQYPKTHQDGRGGFFTGFKVNKETGEAEKVSLFDTKDAKGVELFQFNTNRIVKVSNKKFALECYKKGKEDVMITVTMD